MQLRKKWKQVVPSDDEDAEIDERIEEDVDSTGAGALIELTPLKQLATQNAKSEAEYDKFVEENDDSTMIEKANRYIAERRRQIKVADFNLTRSVMRTAVNEWMKKEVSTKRVCY